MFIIFVILLVASAYVSNAKIDDNIKVGTNVVIILIILLILVFSIL